MKKQTRLRLTGLVVALLCAIAGNAQSGGSYDLSRHVIAGGGGVSTAGAQRLEGVIGQSVVGTSNGGTFTLNGGFAPGGRPAPTPTPDAPGSIGGQITLADGGAPLGGVSVGLSGASNASTITDDSGFYSFTNLAPGAYNVTPARANFSFSAATPVTLHSGDQLTRDFTAASTLTEPQPANGAVLISEFRFSGATSDDEFIELYNNTDAPVDISGYKLDALAGLTITLSANTVIPARGHFLIAHATGYTLAAYAAADGAYAFDLPAQTGLVLLDQSNNVVDAVGFNSTSTPYREGNGLAAVGDLGQYSFARKLTSGVPQDTGDNAADFALVAPDPSTFNNATPLLGAPGPENLSSPIQRNATIKAALPDPACGGQTGTPNSGCQNRVRDTSDPAAPFGTLTFRRKFTNTTGVPVSRLRFRVAEVTAGAAPAGTADLRALDSADVGVMLSNGTTAQVRGLTLETPPAQTQGGGLNSSLAVGVITLNTPLGAGASIVVQFRLGVQQGGAYRFFINVEALTNPPPQSFKAQRPKAQRPSAKTLEQN